MYKSTYQRGDGLESDVPGTTTLWRDHVIMWSKDLGRSIDYLETRPDIDRSKLAYYGLSWGGQMGGILPALEPRLKASVIYSGGFDLRNSLPEVDPINFAPHIVIPTLMLNGRSDLLPGGVLSGGDVPPARYSAGAQTPGRLRDGYNVPRPELIKETLNWLDRYLGPAR